jgi:hypothetical protein
MPDNPQPVRFYKKSAAVRAGAAPPHAASREPVLLARHSAGFSAALIAVLGGRMVLFEPPASDFDLFSAVLVLLFWALFWSVLFAAGLAWARVQRLPSFWWAFAAGAVTSIGFYAAYAGLSYLYGVDATAGDGRGPGPKSYVAAWMVGYSFVMPALAGIVTARAWLSRQRRVAAGPV